MLIGELLNNGVISMTARGTWNEAGENVYLWKNIDRTFEYVPAVGGAAGESVVLTTKGSATVSANGNNGGRGKNRAAGGGGSGRII